MKENWKEKGREKEGKREKHTQILMQNEVETKPNLGTRKTGSRCGLNSLYHSRIVKSILDQTWDKNGMH